MSLEPKPRTRASQAGRGEREGRVNVILGPALKRRAENRKEWPGWSPYVRALVEADLHAPRDGVAPELAEALASALPFVAAALGLGVLGKPTNNPRGVVAAAESALRKAGYPVEAVPLGRAKGRPL